MKVFAFRPLSSVLGLAALLTACGGDATGPAGQLNPAATRQDIQRVEAAYSNSSVRAFEGASPAIDAALGTVFLSAFVTPGSPASTGRLQRFGREQLSLLDRAPASGTALTTVAASIPTAALGRTFEWNATLGRYAVAQVPPAELPAVPSNGVRFLLYEWTRGSEVPASPLTRVGYVDLLETTNAQGRTYRLIVTANSTVYLDYSTSFQFSQAQQSAVLNVSGFVTDGTTRANFTLVNSITAANNGTVSFDYTVTVPSENITLDYFVALRDLSTPFGNEQLVVEISLQGDGGRIDLDGTLTVVQGADVDVDGDDIFVGFGGTLTVRVNNGIFATITLNGSGEPIILNAQGAALSSDEADALEDVFDLIEDGFDFIEDLLDPVDQFFD